MTGTAIRILWRTVVYGTAIAAAAVAILFFLLADAFLEATWGGHGTAALTIFLLFFIYVVTSYCVGARVAWAQVRLAERRMPPAAWVVFFLIGILAVSGVAAVQIERLLFDPRGVRHLEYCIDIRTLRSRATVSNKCEEPVAVQFMGRGQPAIEETLDPAAASTFDQDASGGYIYTACPAGHESSVPFSALNWTVIQGSRYGCIPK